MEVALVCLLYLCNTEAGAGGAEGLHGGLVALPLADGPSLLTQLTQGQLRCELERRVRRP